MTLWAKIVEKAKDIDAWRKFHLAFAEWVDAWRIIPRLVVMFYAYMMWNIIQWYMNLQPFVIKNCDIKTLGALCIASSPSTEHMALVTAVLAVAAAVFGLYTGSGRKWEGSGFIHWNTKSEQEELANPDKKPQDITVQKNENKKTNGE